MSFYAVFRRASTMATGVKRKAVDLAEADAKKPKANGTITSFFGAPKPVANPAGKYPPVLSPAVKFDKEAWLAKLTDEQKELLKLEIETLHESWLAYLKDEVLTKEFLDLKRFLKKEKEDGKTIFPPLEDVYSWSVLLRYATHDAPALPNITLTAILGRATRPSTPSKPSSSAKTPTTTSTKPTGSASPSALLRPPLRLSKTSTPP